MGCVRYDDSDTTVADAVDRLFTMQDQLRTLGGWSGPSISAMLPGLPPFIAVPISRVLMATARKVAAGGPALVLLVAIVRLKNLESN